MSGAAGLNTHTNTRHLNVKVMFMYAPRTCEDPTLLTNIHTAFPPTMATHTHVPHPTNGSSHTTWTIFDITTPKLPSRLSAKCALKARGEHYRAPAYRFLAVDWLQCTGFSNVIVDGYNIMHEV